MPVETSRLPDWLAEALGPALAVRAVKKGDVLFRNGDPVGAIYFVMSGEMKAARYLPDGAEVVMMRAGPGEFFAESALAAERYSCDAICVKLARIAVLPVRAVTGAMADPGFARAFVMAVAGHARRQCSRYENWRWNWRWSRKRSTGCWANWSATG